MSSASSVMSCRTVCSMISFLMLGGLAPLLTACPDLLQVLTLLAMERPISFSAEDIRDEKVRLALLVPPFANPSILREI